MLDFLLRYPNKIWNPFLSHIAITLEALIISLVIAFLLTILLMSGKTVSRLAIGFFSGVYCIPSLAFFALLIPFLGLGKDTAIVVLVTYNQFFLLRSFIGGIRNVDHYITEAAYAMGLGRLQVFVRIQLPLALPSMLAGIRIAALSTVGIAVIGASINAGGLGVLLFDGMRTRNTVKIVWGVILAALLNLLLNGILTILERVVRKKLRMERFG